VLLFGLAVFANFFVREGLVVVDDAQALIGLELFDSAWLIGLAAFGLHLIVLGFLVARSVETPRWLGHLMMVAGAAYIIDTTAHTVLANYADHADAFLVMVAVPSVVAWRSERLHARSTPRRRRSMMSHSSHIPHQPADDHVEQQRVEAARRYVLQLQAFYIHSSHGPALSR
jgi:hypothetical protein